MIKTAEKVACRVALVGLAQEAAQMMRQVFAQFKITAVECTYDAFQRHGKRYVIEAVDEFFKAALRALDNLAQLIELFFGRNCSHTILQAPQ